MGNGSGSHDIDHGNAEGKEPWKKFVVILAGKTNGAHKPVVRRLRSKRQIEVKSPEEADYCLVFCPVVSRVGTDVSDAMERIPKDKKAVLVVMHHTNNRKQVIPRSRRLVERGGVRLTLDYLFHQDKLLNCKLNKKMNHEIDDFGHFQSTSGCVPTCLQPQSDDDEPY